MPACTSGEQSDSRCRLQEFVLMSCAAVENEINADYVNMFVEEKIYRTAIREVVALRDKTFAIDCLWI